jgi:hypothetical protein
MEQRNYIKIQWIVVLLFIFQFTHSQVNILDKKVSGNYTKVPVKQILTDLSISTNIRFSYSPKQIPDDTKISISFSNVSMREALLLIGKQLPVDFELVDNYVILKKREEPVKTLEPVVVSKPQIFTISGFLKDTSNGEFLPGATIYFPELKMGTFANGYGYFSMSLPTGKYKIQISFVGFEPREMDIDLSKSVKLELGLKQALNKLEEVVVSSVSQNDVVLLKRVSQEVMTPMYVAQKPALMGEPDVIKALEFQPGIVFQNDGSSFFHVRGGNYDQNLIILDDAPIFNPSHLLGIFSPIIPDAIQSVDIYKADYPVNFGGRLSSVVDIRTKDGNKNQFSASGNIGLISARGTIEGPIKKESSSYFLSFRRSYFDEYIKPSQPNLNNLYFNDFTAKLNFKVGDNNRLYFTLYKGNDLFRVKNGGDDQMGLNWGNTSASFRWNHLFGARSFLNTTVCFSEFNYYLNTSVKNNIYWNSRISNFSLKTEYSYFINSSITLKSGLKLSFYNFNPGNYYNPQSSNNIQVSPVNSVESIIFSGVEHKISPILKLNYGLRLSSWSNSGEAFVMQFDENHVQAGIKYYKKNEKYYTYPGVEPRLSGSLKTSQNSCVKASYSRNIQFLNLINNSISPFNSLEVWLPSGPNIKPQLADIVDIGFENSFSGLNFTTDLYYKWLRNQIGYKYHANMLVNPAIEGELRQGSGNSYGWEVSIRKKKGKFSGGIEYTYSRAFLKIDGLNNNRTYPATFDRPHNATFDISYYISPRWLVNASYHIMSGMRISTPTSFYIYKGYQVPVFTEQNNDKMPTYKRFDISTNITLNKLFRKFHHSLNIAIINFFNTKNPIFLYYNKIQNADGAYLVPANKDEIPVLKPTYRYVYGFIPSVSYNFKF